MNTSIYILKSMKNYVLAYSYLNVKGPPLSDYYDYINFVTVNNLNCLT